MPSQGKPITLRTDKCGTCRARKVRLTNQCDAERPRCRRCLATGWECEGYDQNSKRPFVHFTPFTPNSGRSSPVPLRKSQSKLEVQLTHGLCDEIDAAPDCRLQLLAAFLDSYLPQARTGPSQSYETGSSWIESIPDHLGRCRIFDDAVMAFCLAHIGRIKGDTILWKNHSQRTYISVLTRIGRIIKTGAPVKEEHLATIMAMAMYELYNCSYGQARSWMVHVQGACSLLEQRGPPSERMPLNAHLYSRLRTVAFYDSCGRRKPTFLCQSEWQGLSKEPYGQLLDLLMCIPSLLEKADTVNITCSISAFVAIQEILLENSTLEHRMLRWYWELQSRRQGPLFLIRTAKSDIHVMLDDDCDLKDIFDDTVDFPNIYLTQLVLAFWCGLVILYTEMIRLHRKLQSLRSDSEAVQDSTLLVNQSDIEQLEKAGNHFAAKICQAIPACYTDATGNLGIQIALSPLWSAQQFYEGRSLQKYAWCQMVLKSFRKRGFGMGASIMNLSHKQYADIGNEK